MSIRDEQYKAWGAIIRNARVNAAHIMNGVAQLMRLYPSLRATPLACVVPPGGELPTAYVDAVKARLDVLYSGHVTSWRFPKAAVGYSVTKSNASGALGFTEGARETEGDKRAMKPARDHAARRFVKTPSARAHELLAGALNADGRVYISSNADDPTTTGIQFAGYSNNYTLDLMHASTLLALIGNGALAESLLDKLYALLLDDHGPHQELVSTLELSNGPPPCPLPPYPHHAAPFPLPPGEGWGELAAVAETAVSRLFLWDERGESKANTLMMFSDLSGLLLSSRFATWASTPPLLMAAPLAPRQRNAALVIEAQRALQTAMAKINADAAAAELIEVKKARRLDPKPVYRNLLQATGWLYPHNAQGGARQHLRPASRQLMTLTRALVAPGEEISWSTFRARARALHVEVGGAPTASLPSTVPALLLTRAGDLHKEHLVALGMARQESDNVVRVDGGWA